VKGEITLYVFDEQGMGIKHAKTEVVVNILSHEVFQKFGLAHTACTHDVEMGIAIFLRHAFELANYPTFILAHGVAQS
jgi:hypothetical protein